MQKGLSVVWKQLFLSLVLNVSRIHFNSGLRVIVYRKLVRDWKTISDKKKWLLRYFGYKDLKVDYLILIAMYWKTLLSSDDTYPAQILLLHIFIFSYLGLKTYG